MRLVMDAYEVSMNKNSPEAGSTPTLLGVIDGFGLFAIACVMSIAFLFFDLILPLGIAGGVGHVAVVLLGLWFPNRKQVIDITTFCVVLIIAGYFLSPEGGILWKVLVNRGLAMFVVISTGAVIYISRMDARGKAKPPIKYKQGFFLSACALLLAFLAVDLLLPLGIAGGVSYVAAILLGLWFPLRKQVAIITLASVFLTIFGYLLSPEDGELWKAIFNRGLAIFTIISTGAVIFFSRNTNNEGRSSLEQHHKNDAPADTTSKIEAFAQDDDSYDSISVTGFRGLLAGFPVLLLIVGVTFLSDKEQEEVFRWVSHTHEVLHSLSSVLTTIKDAETGQRDFLLTGEGIHLEPYTNAVKQLDGSIKEVRRLTLDNPGRQTRLDKAELLIKEKLKELSETISLWKSEGPEATIRVVATGTGGMEQLRAIIVEMEAQETRLLEEREAIISKDKILFESIGIIGSVLLLMIGTIVVFRARSLLASRHETELLLRRAKEDTERANIELQSLTEDLESRVKERTHDLKESELALSRAQKMARLGSWTWHIETGENPWSDEQYDIFGLDPDKTEPSFELFMSLLHPDDKGHVQQSIKDALDGSRPYDCEYRIIRPDGEVRNIHAQGEISYDAAGQPEKMYGTIFDITEKKTAEATTRQVQKMESLGSLAGGIAHDINNMLVPIQNITEMTVKELPEGNPMRRDLGIVLVASEKIKDLVDKILSFSRQDSAQKKDIDISNEVRDVVDLIRSTIPTSIIFISNIAPEIGMVSADKTQFSTILTNLVTNAIDAMTGATGELIVSLKKSKTGQDGQEYAMLTVVDTGVGISPEVIHRVYDPFFTTKEVGSGTGMGLSMIYGIVTSHGGEMNITSKPGQGTTVSIYLPILKEGTTLETVKLNN